MGSAGYSMGVEALAHCSPLWESISGFGKQVCLFQPPWKDAQCTALGSAIPIVQCTTYTLVCGSLVWEGTLILTVLWALRMS